MQALHVKHIVVLGHAQCGGIRAFADKQAPLSPGDFIGRWMSQIAPAADTLGEKHHHDHGEYLRRLEFASVELSLRNLMTFPWVKRRVDEDKLKLHGAFSALPKVVCSSVTLRQEPSSRLSGQLNRRLTAPVNKREWFIWKIRKCHKVRGGGCPGVHHVSWLIAR